MNKWILFILILLSAKLFAQNVQTIVPEQPVVLGNAFQVQYVIQGASSPDEVISSSFDALQIISGPHFYQGKMIVEGKEQAIRNISFTLMAKKTGRITIPGIRIKFQERELTADPGYITVIPQMNASYNSRSSYTEPSLYAPGSDAEMERILADNIFVKADVDRRTVFIGEPLVATFTLYSRLQSTSEVMNSPSLYGFSVSDMINIHEAHQSVTSINGKIYNTSTLRKLQLFPEREGRLIIDPMDVEHDVEFIFSGNSDKKIVHKFTSTEPIVINVKPLPLPKPDEYNGAVGKFDLAVVYEANYYAGKEGKIILRIKGEGNFSQFGNPSLVWPESFEVLEPVSLEQLNRNTVPLSGWVDYIYSFIPTDSGLYVLPPVEFAYFNSVSKKYMKTSTDPIRIHVTKAVTRPKEINSISEPGNRTGLWLFALAIPLVISLYYFLKKKNKTESISVKTGETMEKTPEEWIVAMNDDDIQAGALALHKLLKSINTNRLDHSQLALLNDLMKRCHIAAYALETDKRNFLQLKQETLELFSTLNSQVP